MDPSWGRGGSWTSWAQVLGRSSLSCRWLCHLPAWCWRYGSELQRRRNIFFVRWTKRTQSQLFRNAAGSLPGWWRLTFHLQIYDDLWVVNVSAGVTHVWSLVLHLHPHQQQRGVPSGDLVLEEWSPALERWYLWSQLVFVVIVWMDDLFARHFHPVDESISSREESARKDASLSYNTDCWFCEATDEEAPSTFRLIFDSVVWRCGLNCGLVWNVNRMQAGFTRFQSWAVQVSVSFAATF